MRRLTYRCTAYLIQPTWRHIPMAASIQLSTNVILCAMESLGSWSPFNNRASTQGWRKKCFRVKMFGIVMASLSSFICPIMLSVRWARWAPWTVLFILHRIHYRLWEDPLSCLLKRGLVEETLESCLWKMFARIFHRLLPVVDPIYSFMQAFSLSKLFLWPAECNRKCLFLISNPLCGGGRGLCRHLSASQTAWRKQSATREGPRHAFYSVTTLLHFRHDITAIRDHFQRYTRLD